MTAISFTGLASGLDTASLVDKLVAAERSAVNVPTGQQSDLVTQKSIVGSLSSALSALGDATRALDLDSEVKPRTATVAGTGITAAVSSNAAAGVHSLRVKAVAAAQVVQSKTFAGNTAGVAGVGGVTITVGGTPQTVSWDATDTLDTIAQKINDAGANVSASVLKADDTHYSLVVTANQTGTANKATFADSGSGLDFGLAANERVPAADAVVAIDGIDVTRSTNTITDALTGVTLNVTAKAAATDPDAQLSVALDQKGLTTKLKAVVDAYNSVNAALHVQLDYTGTAKGSSTLFGDSTLEGLQTALAGVMSSAYGSSNLGAIGISRDKTGAMTLDEAKLATALGTDPNAVSSVFVSGGFATAVGSLADQYTTATTGILAVKVQGMTDRSTQLQDSIDRINTNADALQDRLNKQFSALEQAMSTLQSQSAYLTRMLG